MHKNIQTHHSTFCADLCCRGQECGRWPASPLSWCPPVGGSLAEWPQSHQGSAYSWRPEQMLLPESIMHTTELPILSTVYHTLYISSLVLEKCHHQHTHTVQHILYCAVMYIWKPVPSIPLTTLIIFHYPFCFKGAYHASISYLTL